MAWTRSAADANGFCRVKVWDYDGNVVFDELVHGVEAADMVGHQAERGVAIAYARAPSTDRIALLAELEEMSDILDLNDDELYAALMEDME